VVSFISDELPQFICSSVPSKSQEYEGVYIVAPPKGAEVIIEFPNPNTIMKTS
jgi:hypothetical protein